MNIHKIPSNRPLDLSSVVTLSMSLIIPVLMIMTYTLFVQYQQNHPATSIANLESHTATPTDELLAYQDNVALTTMLSEKKSQPSVLSAKVTTGSAVTPGSSKILEVPSIKQTFKLSCEIASIQMVLNYFGRNDQDQAALMNQMGYAQPIKSQSEGGRMIWGDPDQGFVGEVDGYMNDKKLGLKGATGWGTHKGPVARLLKEYYPKSFAAQGNIETLKANLDQGNPVIFWHVRDDGNQEIFEYFTPEGKRVEFKQYHVAVIRGYEVAQDGTIQFVVNDPYFDDYRISATDLQRIWGKHNYDMVVAVK